jgi:glyoxylase I family protein
MGRAKNASIGNIDVFLKRREDGMKSNIKVGPLHNVMLTVSDSKRSGRFYREVLGFQESAEFEDGPMLTNGSMYLILFPAPGKPIEGDRFDEDRIGLQHISFSVGSLQELQEAERILDGNNVPHGLIEDFGPDMGMYSLRMRDPDNIQVELLAPYGAEREG